MYRCQRISNILCLVLLCRFRIDDVASLALRRAWLAYLVLAGTGRRVENQAAPRRSPDKRGPKAVSRRNWRKAGLPNWFHILKESHPREGGATTGDDLEPGKAAHNPPKKHRLLHAARLAGMLNPSRFIVPELHVCILAVVIITRNSSRSVFSAKTLIYPGAVFSTFHFDPRLSRCVYFCFPLARMVQREWGYIVATYRKHVS